MAFAQIEDYNSTIHAEIINAMVRENTDTISDAEAMAIGEISGYLNGRYDVEQIFSATGDDRNAFILMVVKDITVYHLSCMHNPQKFSQIRQNRYDQAIDKLERVQNGKFSPVGLPVKTFETSDTDTPEGGYLLSSNPKRNNHY
jgi:phage gp36-like protein